MRQNEVFPYYKRCTAELEKLYSYLYSQYAEDSIEQLCKLRGYVGKEQAEGLRDFGIGIAPDIDIDGIIDEDMVDKLGIYSNGGEFLLRDRFIIPLEDTAGNLVSLVGYYPDRKKYITLPTPFFSKECLFFNYKQAYDLAWSKYGGKVILVEGLFDCISIRSLGLPCIATMGATVSKNKGELLKVFSKVLGVPDNDKTGRKSLNRYVSRGWQVPDNTIMLKLVGGDTEIGGETLKCKDMDNLVSWYDADEVRDILLACFDSNEEVEELML